MTRHIRGASQVIDPAPPAGQVLCCGASCAQAGLSRRARAEGVADGSRLAGRQDVRMGEGRSVLTLRQGSGRAPSGDCVLGPALRSAVGFGVGFSAVLPMASPHSPSRRRQSKSSAAQSTHSASSAELPTGGARSSAPRCR